MSEHHNTFTWYDTKPEDYPTRRNRRIALKRELTLIAVAVIVWGGVWLWVA